MTFSFFDADGDLLVPTPMACSLWSKDQMHGVATSGALARAVEAAVLEQGRTELRAARWTVDLFRPARMVPCAFEVEVVREGPRLCLADVTMSQDGTPVARGSALFLKPGETPEGEVWAPDAAPEPPSLEVAPVSEDPHVPFLRSDAGWSQSFKEHQVGARHATWQTAVPVLLDERPSGFQATASIADATSMVTNLGSHGVEFINTDITLTLARLPRGLQLGLETSNRVEHDGISVGTATVFDRDGAFGTTVVTAVANAKRTVDFSGVEYSDDGSRVTPGA